MDIDSWRHLWLIVFLRCTVKGIICKSIPVFDKQQAHYVPLDVLFSFLAWPLARVWSIWLSRKAATAERGLFVTELKHNRLLQAKPNNYYAAVSWKKCLLTRDTVAVRPFIFWFVPFGCLFVHSSANPLFIFSFYSCVESFIRPFIRLYNHSVIHFLPLFEPAIYPCLYRFIHSFLFPSIYPFFCPSIHPFAHLCICPSIHYIIHPFYLPLIHSSTHSSIYPVSMYALTHVVQCMHLSIHPSIHPFSHLSIHSQINLSTHSSIHPSIHPSVCPYFHPCIWSIIH